MFDLEVFDLSVLQDLKLRKWSEVDVFAAMLSQSTANITNDGHLVLWSKRIGSSLRSSALDLFNSVRPAGDDELLIEDGFLLKVFYRDKLYRGKHFHWKRAPSGNLKSYREDPNPEVFGNFEDQEPGFTAITVVLSKRRLTALREKWKGYSLGAGRHRKSSLRLAGTGSAIQLRLSCDEVGIEDVIDVLVDGLFAIKKQRKALMVLGLSFTRVVTAPTLREVHVVVEEEYGPFESV